MKTYRFEENHIKLFNREIIITEKNDEIEYHVQFRLKAASVNGLFIDVPLIKKNARYLIHNNPSVRPPKDCDGIILDLDKKIIYIVELKSSSSSATNDRIDKQLLAGERWLEHIAFCLDVDISEFEQTIRVVVVANAVFRSRSRDYSHFWNPDYKFFKIPGKSVALEYIN